MGREFDFGNGNWVVEVVEEAPIANAEKLQYFEDTFKVSALPEMIFDGNLLRLSHAGGSTLEFTAEEGLRMARRGDPEIRDKFAQTWQGKEHTVLLTGAPEAPIIKDAQLKTHDHNISWTFETDYRGTFYRTRGQEKVAIELEPGTEEIPMERLRDQSLPILFQSAVDFYEDELADGGETKLSVRARVMPDFFYVLCRHWLRVDEVQARLKDTRIFHDLGTDFAIVEVTERSMPLPKIPPGAEAQHRKYDNPDELQGQMDIDSRTLYRLPFN